MAVANITWRHKGVEGCCYRSLRDEMYRRRQTHFGGLREELMIENQIFKCQMCGSEMICDKSKNDGRLRWRANDAR